MKFNFKDIEERSLETTSFKPIPDGVYQIKVLDARESISQKSGAEMIEITAVEVMVGNEARVLENRNKKENKSYGIFYISTANANFFKKNIFALGLRSNWERARDSENGNGSITAIDVVGKVARAVVVNQSTEKDGKVYTRSALCELLGEDDDAQDRLNYYLHQEQKKQRQVRAAQPSPTQGSVRLNDEVPF